MSDEPKSDPVLETAHESMIRTLQGADATPEKAKRFLTDAQELLAYQRRHEIGFLDNAGGDSEQIREELIAHWLKQKYGK